VTVRRVFIVCALLAITAVLHAQAKAFDVASVKRAATLPPGIPPIIAVRSGHLLAPFATLHELVQAAYGVDENQVIDGPDWIDRDHFEINATVPTGSSQADIEAMLQSLLGDRFGLVAHRDTRELPSYLIERAGNTGSQIWPSGPDCRPMTPPPGMPGVPPPPPPPPAGTGPVMLLNQAPGARSACGNMVFNGHISARNMDIRTLAWSLARLQHRPVIDRSGMTGLYDFDLIYTPDGGPLVFNGVRSPADGPALATAMREQLGLKLESTRAPIDVVVIDRVSPPTEN